MIREGHCPECDFDWDAPVTEQWPTVAGAAERWRSAISDDAGKLRPAAALRRRPTDDVWSPLEYLAHMADVVTFYDDRFRRVLTQDRPLLEVGVRFAELAEIRSYRDLDPGETLVALEAAVASAEDRLSDLGPDHWARVGIGSEGDERTLAHLANRLAHEVKHHLLDVERMDAG